MGGAAGHINHPYDRPDITFKDLKEMGIRALEGKLDQEQPISEKVDGIQLQVTFKDGKLKIARNKKHLLAPITPEELGSKYDDNEDLQDAFTLASKDLESALLQLPDDFLQDLFKDGTRFLNLEILYPPKENVISYGKTPYIQLHGIVQYDQKGEPIGESSSTAKKLVDALQKGKIDKQETFTIIGTKEVKLKKVKNVQEEKADYLTKINKLQKEFRLQDNDEIRTYYEKWWEKYLEENYPDYTGELKSKLINRWAHDIRTPRLSQKDFETKTEYERIKDFEETELKQIQDGIEGKFKIVILELGIKVLNTAENYLSTVSAQKFRNSLALRIKSIKDELDNHEERQRAYDELKMIQTLGGLDNAVPIEGIVFYFKKNQYKLTGLYAPLNQLLGFFRYSRVER